MSYLHLTIKERYQIEAFCNEGHSIRKIASLMHVNPSTISRELKRSPGKYSAEAAQSDADQCSSRKGRHTLFTPSLAKTIEEKLRETLSPEQVKMALKEKCPCFKTIYNWLCRGMLSVGKETLRRKGRQPKTKEPRGKFANGKSISERPEEVNSRQTFGHWEIDTVVSPRGKDKACTATFLERKTRFYISVLMPDRSATSMLQVIRQLVAKYGRECFKSMTSDRGKEFACFEDVERMGIDFYFADPYASWQRGSNENANGLLREFFPKGTCFSKVDQEEMDNAVTLINKRPRKCLNAMTALEVFTAEISSL